MRKTTPRRPNLDHRGQEIFPGDRVWCWCFNDLDAPSEEQKWRWVRGKILGFAPLVEWLRACASPQVAEIVERMAQRINPEERWAIVRMPKRYVPQRPKGGVEAIPTEFLILDEGGPAPDPLPLPEPAGAST